MIRIWISALLALASSTVVAGTVMQTVMKDLNSNRADSTATTYAQDGKLRVEMKPGDSYMIFKDDVIYSIDPGKKTYMAMDRATMQRMADQVNPALKQMQEQLAKMSPEERAQMEKMLGGRMPGLGKEKVQEVKRTNRTGKFGAHGCTYVEVHEDGVLTDELCIAPTNQLKGAPELMSAATKMSDLVKEMVAGIQAPWVKQMLDRQVENYTQLGGIPVFTRHYAEGKAVNETTLQSIRTESLAAPLFDLPAGYTKRDMMQGR